MASVITASLPGNEDNGIRKNTHLPAELLPGRKRPAIRITFRARGPGAGGGNRKALAGHKPHVRTDWAAFSDRELWSRAVEHHDGYAFGQLFERHADAVFTHCFRRTGLWSTAEDLTSVVFLEAWRRRREVRICDDSVLPWLLAVANNATRNAERTLRRNRRLTAKLPPPEEMPDIAETAAQRVDQERAMRWLLGELQGLRRPEREVLALCDWAGLSYAEASAVMGVPVGTVRSRLARARRRLRDRASGTSIVPAETSCDSPPAT